MQENIIDLIILRHGEAGTAPIDQERPLTERGQQQILKQYEWLQQQNFQPELILHSPYKRTIETAALATDIYPDAKLQVEPLITPDGDPAMVASFVQSMGTQQILIASHMPMVSYLTMEFVRGIDIFSYPVAGLCWIQISNDDAANKLLHKHWVKNE